MRMNCRGKFKFAKKKIKFEPNVSRVVPLHQWFESILQPLMKSSPSSSVVWKYFETTDEEGVTPKHLVGKFTILVRKFELSFTKTDTWRGWILQNPLRAITPDLCSK